MPPFQLMGIVNVTPDSFSDGGRYMDRGAAIRHGLELAAEGAAILDIGGESTRPGAQPVGIAEELARVLPVIEGLRAAGFDGEISVDTSKLAVARAALDAGATLLNDVTALRAAPALAELAAERDATVLLMHMLGEPRTMQDHPHYDDVVSTPSSGSCRSAPSSPCAAESGPSGSCSTPASASARRSPTTSSCCSGSTSWWRSASRSWSAPAARPSWARSRGARSTSGCRPRSRPTCSPTRAARRSSACTTSPPLYDALQVAAATFATTQPQAQAPAPAQPLSAHAPQQHR